MVSVILDELEGIARRIVESEGMELVDLEYKSGQSRNLLRIFIDKSGGVDLDDCEKVSRQVSAILDVKDVLKHAYVLEVSSPGLERPLRTDRDFRRALGKELRVKYFQQPESTVQVTGKLTSIQEQTILLENSDGEIEIPLDLIKHAAQEVTIGQLQRKPKKRK